LRILAARMNHETNMFSPLPTPLASFEPLWGDEARRFGETSRTAFGAFVAYANAHDANLATPVAATANPSGPVDDAAFETMASVIVDAARQGHDAILLDLHGAMATRSLEDAEGELLARVRAAAPGVPIGVALDLHGNVTPAMLAHCDVIVGFKTYPHIDMYETGEHVARLVERMLHSGLQPKMAWRHPPLLAHTLKMNTAVAGAMTDLVALARQAEGHDGVLAATVFGGFTLSDIAEAGLSIVTVAQSEAAAAQAADRIAKAAWARRAEFVYHEAPLAESIAAARRAFAEAGGPVLMLDHGDNCMSGGTCDVMDVLEAALAAGCEGVLAGPIADPEAVEALHGAGLGAMIELGVGNKVAAAGFPSRPPLALAGVVEALSEGVYTVSGPIYTGQTFSMGRAALLRTPQARVLITERPHEPWDLGVFACAGLDPRQAAYLILKSRMYCRPVFEPLATATIECASAGVTSSNYSLFAFTRLARPAYPLEPEASWGEG
jgi:microcystin degradation protein MlrC